MEAQKRRDNKKFSGWELNMMMELLTDISVNKCDNLFPEEISDFKTYVGKVVSGELGASFSNPQFTELYGSLVKCFQHNVELENR